MRRIRAATFNPAPACSPTCIFRLRVVHGPHANPEFFTDADIERFYGAGFTVHHQSARTGVRLIGPKPGWARSDGGDAGLHPSNIHDTGSGKRPCTKHGAGAR